MNSRWRGNMANRTQDILLELFHIISKGGPPEGNGGASISTGAIAGPVNQISAVGDAAQYVAGLKKIAAGQADTYTGTARTLVTSLAGQSAAQATGNGTSAASIASSVLKTGFGLLP